MKKQSEITKTVEVGDIYLYSKLDLMFTQGCIKICFRQMTEEEFESFNKVAKSKVPSIFATDYAVCIRAIYQKITTWF